MLQNEFEINKNSKLHTDLSFLADKKEGHIFLNFDKDLNLNKSKKTNISFKLQQTSNDTYIKANKVTSPIINNYDVLENSLRLKMSSDRTSIFQN